MRTVTSLFLECLRTRASLGSLVLLMVCGLMSGTAFAIDGLTYASGLSPSGSEPTRTVSVVCPEDTLAIGGGAIISGSNKVAFSSAIPDGRIYKVAANEPPGGVSSDWNIVAIAICAPRSSLPGLDRREVISRTNADTLATPRCAAGQALIGMGGEILGAGQIGFALTGIRTSDDLTTATVQGGPTATPASWSLRAVGLCIDRVPGQQLAQSASALNATDRKTTRALCPAGTSVHSIGFDFTARRGELYATKLFPRIDLFGSGTDEGADVDGLETPPGFVVGGVDASWLIRAQALCAN